MGSPCSSLTHFKPILWLPFDHNLHQLITDVTHIKGNTLDLLITNLPEMFSNLNVSSDTISYLDTDHFFVSFDLFAHHKPVPHHPSKFFNFFEADMEGLSNYLLDFDFSPCLTSTHVKFAWSLIKHAVHSGISHYVSVVQSRSRSYPRWSSSDIIHDCNCLHTFRRSKASDKFTRLKQPLSSRITKAKQDYESSLVNNQARMDCAKVFAHIHFITYSFDIPSSVYLDNT